MSNPTNVPKIFQVILLLMTSLRIIEGSNWCSWSAWTGWAGSSKWPQDSDNKPAYPGSYFSHRSRACTASCTGGACGDGDMEATKECLNHQHCAQQQCASSDASHPPHACTVCEKSQSQWNDMCPGTTDPVAKCHTCREYDSPQGFSDAYCLKNGQCLPRCNWLGHDCWPGTCTKPEYLATSCQCTRGFQLPKNKPDNETRCNLNHVPDITRCQLHVTSPGGETIPQKGSTTQCKNWNDVVISFSPSNVAHLFEFMFELPEDIPTYRHKHIHDFRFGITAATIRLNHHKRDGTTSELLQGKIDDVAECNHGNYNNENPTTDAVACQQNSTFTIAVEDGEKVCYQVQVTASGFLRVKDLYNGGAVSSKRFYDRTFANSEVCFITDFNPPSHCSIDGLGCTNKMLDFGDRVTSSTELTVTASGWEDINGGHQRIAPPSGISYYQLNVFNVNIHSENIVVDKTKALYNDLNENSPMFKVKLSYVAPQMYAIYMTVFDKARPDGNKRSTRGFVLVDHTSQIKVNALSPLVVTSASEVSNYHWQTHLEPITLRWTGRYYNDYYKEHNLLKPIKVDPDVNNMYDQTNGILPVHGTTNVDGIVKVYYNYNRTTNQLNSAEYKNLPSFTSESLELAELNLKDGDVIDVGIKVEDIRGNTKEEAVNVKIDSTKPMITDITLINQTLYVQAKDIHSGIDRIEWKIEESINSSNILSGVFHVQNSCDEQECVCPTIGDCQAETHVIDIAQTTSSIVHDNASFMFQIKVFNKAGLTFEDDFNCTAGCLTFEYLPEVFTTTRHTSTFSGGQSSSPTQRSSTNTTVDNEATSKPNGGEGLLGLGWPIWGGIFGAIAVIIIIVTVLAIICGVRRSRRRQKSPRQTDNGENRTSLNDDHDYADVEEPSTSSGRGISSTGLEATISKDISNMHKGNDGVYNHGYDTVDDSSKQDDDMYACAAEPPYFDQDRRENDYTSGILLRKGAKPKPPPVRNQNEANDGGTKPNLPPSVTGKPNTLKNINVQKPTTDHSPGIYEGTNPSADITQPNEYEGIRPPTSANDHVYGNIVGTQMTPEHNCVYEGILSPPQDHRLEDHSYQQIKPPTFKPTTPAKPKTSGKTMKVKKPPTPQKPMTPKKPPYFDKFNNSDKN